MATTDRDKSDFREELIEQAEAEKALGRTTSDPVLERKVVCACLQDNECLKAAVHLVRTAEDLTDRKLRLSLDAAFALHSNSVSIIQPTVISELTAQGFLDSAGGEEFVTALFADDDYDPEEITAYCQQLRVFTHRRKIEKAGRKISSYSKSPVGIKESTDLAREALAEIEGHAFDGKFLSLGEILEDIGMDRFFDPYAGMDPPIWPWKGLNELTIGFFPGCFYILAARPSVGKTVVAAQALMEESLKRSTPTALISLEMKAASIFLRCCCNLANVDSFKVRDKAITPEERGRLAEAAVRLATAPFKISNLAGRTPAQARTMLRDDKRKRGTKIGAIDHMQLMRGDKKHYTNRREEMDYISNSLAETAKELDMAILGLSQMRRLERAKSGMADKRPTLEDLRETGTLEQDGDVIMLLDRPEKNKKGGDTSKAELEVAKQREGPTGFVRLRMEPEFSRFYEEF